MFKFKKIASILASTLMLGSTIGLAAVSAANYPSPFVMGGSADAAIVYGTTAANTDLVAVIDIQSSLNGAVTSTSVTTSDSVEGEAYPLFTSGTPLLLNSSLNAARGTVSKTNMPTVLADGQFQTTSNIDYVQRIYLGSDPKVEFKQQPSSNDDPVIGLALSSAYVYNISIDFDENVNFTHADSKGETLDLLGQKYTVSGATTTTKLVLLKSSQEITLSNENPSAEVTIEENTYTVELISASDDDANIRVTDSSGGSSSKVVAESNSKTIQGLEVAVDAADENNFQITATLLLGSSRMTFQDGTTVKKGTDENSIDGTQVEFYLSNGTATTQTGTLGEIVIQVSAKNSDNDAVFPGGEFVDPVFGSFKLDFSGISVPTDSSSREEIEVLNSGVDRMTLKFQAHDGTAPVSVDWILNDSTTQGGAIDLADGNAYRIGVVEGMLLNRSEYIVLPNNDGGGLYRISAIYNDSDTNAAKDYVTFDNVLTDEAEKKVTGDTEGTGTDTIQDQAVTVTYTGASTASEETRQIRVNFAESSTNEIMLFPTIATKYGAKIAFYEPATINLAAWDGTNAATGLTFQNGDGYTDLAITGIGTVNGTSFNVTCSGGTTAGVNAAGTSTYATSKACAVGKLTYNITYSAANTTTVYLVDPEENTNIVTPGLIIFEERDDARNYEALIVKLGASDGSSDGVSVTDVIRTWGADSVNANQRLRATNPDLYQEMDLWGSIITEDRSDSNDYSATISYPDEQVYAMLYIAETGASITPGSSGSGGGSANIVVITDSEISSVAGKDIIVVGGSCVNSVAADLLGVATGTCGPAFTDATTVGANSYLIQSFDRTGGKIATLVAGFNAGDTTNAVRYLTTQTVDTSAGKKYVGTSATSAELVTTTTTSNTTA